MTVDATAAAAPRPAFVHIEPVQVWTLPSDRKGWQGGPLAEIRIGEHDGRWFFSTAFEQDRGGVMGHASPLGFWPDGRQESRRGHADPDAALAAAVARLRAMMGGRPKELAAHLAWLDTLAPTQPDLFSTLRPANDSTAQKQDTAA